MDLADDTTTVHSSPQSMSSIERDAVRKGEARGKREYMKEHPQCGLTGATPRYCRNYDLIDWSNK